MKKIETHLHLAPNSDCAIEQPRETARLCRNAGYDGVIVTNHIMRYIFERWQKQGLNPMEFYLKSYHDLKKYGERLGLQVWLGAEVNLDRYNRADINGPVYEFLLYGIDEDFLLANPEIYMLSQEELFSLCASRGVLMVQAHPFRDTSRLADTNLLHGLEVCNANPRHDSHNDEAVRVAEKCGLIATAGSDFHQRGDEGRAYMCVPDDVTDIYGFVNALKNGTATISECEC
ncbi:MAG: PHP domain-containing protein [Christensenellales bacterium]